MCDLLQSFDSILMGFHEKDVQRGLDCNSTYFMLMCTQYMSSIIYLIAQPLSSEERAPYDTSFESIDLMDRHIEGKSFLNENSYFYIFSRYTCGASINRYLMAQRSCAQKQNHQLEVGPLLKNHQLKEVDMGSAS